MMSTLNEHGISIGINRIREQFFIKMKIIGTLTHEDYEMITPMLESALQGIDEPSISLIIDATEFNGWSMQAIWDDLRLGLKHNRDFNKIALVGNKPWQQYGVKISNWFSIGDFEYFENMDDALSWLSQEILYDTNYVNDKDMTANEIESRKDDISNQLENLFKANMKITGWDVPEVDDEKAAKLIVEIFEEKLKKIKEDINNGKYENN